MCNLSYLSVYWAVWGLSMSNSGNDSTYSDRKAQHAAALAIGATTITWADWETASFPPLV